MTARARLAVFAAPTMLVAVVFRGVRATNFSGWDEWLIVSLASRGIVSVPYAHRPLVLLWALPGALFSRLDLNGFFFAHAAYLAASGTITAWLAARLRPRSPAAALTAGVLAALWAPLDYMRLDTVLLTSYSGFTAGSMAAVVLFLEGWLRGRRVLVLLAAAVAVTMVLGFEGTLPLLAAAPLFPLLAPGAGSTLRSRWRWVVAWEVLLALAALPFVLGLLRPAAASYQSALGADLAPLRFAGRVLLQYKLDLGPAFMPALTELAVPACALAAAAFAAFALGAGPEVEDENRHRGPLLLMAAGALLAGLGWVALCASPATRTAARTQILPAPGVGLLLAASCALLSAPFPRRWRRAVSLLAAAYLVVVATGRTVAMQREWDVGTFWPAQRDVLAQLTQAAPSLAPNTLVVLLDDVHAFPASFTFHHAVRTVYGAGVRGHVWGAEPFLYPARFDASGASIEPWPVIRGPWDSPVTHHGYDEIVVAHMGADGHLRLLPAWPPELPALPPDAAYAPLARVGHDPPPAARHILDRVR